MRANDTRRQFERIAVDLAAQVHIRDESAVQVAPLAGRALAARITNISGGGAYVVLPTFLPRETLVDLEVPAALLGGEGAQRIAARVLKPRMVDHEPRYGMGLQYVQDESPVLTVLRQRLANERPRAETAGKPAAPASPAAEDWLEALAGAGLVDVAMLSTAKAECKGDEDAIAEWLAARGCVARRDVLMARADAAGLPFVEPADFRVNYENRALLGEDVARQQVAFPMFCMERVATIAVSRPLELAVLDQIRLRNGREVEQCLASARDIQHLIEWAYGNFGGGNAAAAAADPSLAWDAILADVADSPAVKLVNVLLDQAAAARASDVHIDADEQHLVIRFRIDGVLREVPAPPRSLLPAVVARIKVLGRMDIAETRKPQDGHFKLAYSGDEFDVRVSTLPSANGEAVVLRLLNTGANLLSLEELGMDPVTRERFDRLIHLPHGMLLVTGPTGSGKTTTLYSALTRVDRVRQSIITLEDPVEVRLSRVRQIPVNPKAGLTFQTGLRSILRQDPDCIMIGEIRDRETAEISLQAALTGHLVLSTLHTNSAAAAVARLKDMGAAGFLVASALAGVLAQRLCRRVCAHCARPVEAGSAEFAAGLAALGAPAEAFGADARLLAAVGCKRCGGTGFDGRVGVFELLVADDETRRQILAEEHARAIEAHACSAGMRLLAEDGLDKVRRGMTTAQELARVVGRLERIAPAGKIDNSTGRDAESRLAPARGATGRGAAGGEAAAAPGRPSAVVAKAESSRFDVGEYDALLKRWLASAPESVGAAGSM